MSRCRIIFVFILALALFLRIYKLGENPPSLYWDEVSIGYNAWSILTTGADEYGYKLPLLFESFQEYKLPGYIYTVVPFVRIFGLTEIAVRLPSIIFGIFGVFAVYLLVVQLFNSKIALLSSFFLACSPWHIHFSRAGFEAGAGLTFTIFGIYFFLKGLTKYKYLYFSFIFLFSSLYFYHSFKIFVPLLIFSCFVIYKQQIIRIKKKIIVSILLGFILLIPLFFGFNNSKGFNRFNQVSVFSDPDLIKESIIERQFDKNSFIARIFHHRYLVYLQEIIRGYFSHFSYDFFFEAQEASLRHHVISVGLLYYIELPLIVIGIYALIKKKLQVGKILIIWLLIAPIASSLAKPVPHALRAIIMLPIPHIFSAYGLYFIFNKINGLIRNIAFIVIFLIVIIQMSYYFHQLYIHYPYQFSKEWAYGYKQIIQQLPKSHFKYNNIYITGKYWRPYIFTLFYLKYPAKQYQNNPKHNLLGNIYFGYADYDKSDPYYAYEDMNNIVEKFRNTPGNLLILSPEEVLPQDHVINIISDLRGEPLFLFIDNNKYY